MIETRDLRASQARFDRLTAEGGSQAELDAAQDSIDDHSSTRRDLFSQPHQKHCASNQRRHCRETEKESRVYHRCITNAGCHTF